MKRFLYFLTFGIVIVSFQLAAAPVTAAEAPRQPTIAGNSERICSWKLAELKVWNEITQVKAHANPVKSCLNENASLALGNCLCCYGNGCACQPIRFCNSNRGVCRARC